jgi:uncharacterized Ntn-hydrolase superfamily protein
VTFSIVGFDPATGDLGIAVASKFLAVGAVVPWAIAGVGAVATQANANTAYGPRALELLAQGVSASEAVALLRSEDTQPDVFSRQVGIVDGRGRSASYTGEQCMTWAGGTSGPNFAAQGNILAGPDVVQAIGTAFEQQQQGDLAERLLDALASGQQAGGDRRGQQSAALLVVRQGGGYGGRNDRYIDLRVDDHRQPIDELRRVLQLWRVYFQTANPRELVPLTPELIREVQTRLSVPASGTWDAATRRAVRTWAGVENLEERLRDDDTSIDPIVLRWLREGPS